MFSSNSHDQMIIGIAEGLYLATTIESFLIDRRAAGLSPNSIRYYRSYLIIFQRYCEASAVKCIEQITADLLRHHFVTLAETHNPGGVSGEYRTLRAFFRWLVDEEIMPPDWRNPMSKVKPPKMNMEPLEPIPLEDVRALIDTCSAGAIMDDRDRAIFLVLLDTGVRAQELCDLNQEDVNSETGTTRVRYGKGGKTRTVFLGKRSRKAVRTYLRRRTDREHSLFLTRSGERLTYEAVREMIDRRARQAGLSNKPSAHDFRRAFALNMLRNGADVFALQKLLGHSDLQIMRRYLAQNNQDTQLAHLRGSPVDNGL